MSSSNDKTFENLINKDEWLRNIANHHEKRADLNKLIMNYLVTEGFKEAAEKFQQETGITPPANLANMDERIRIRDAVEAGRIDEAIGLVNQLHPELFDNDRRLYFHLQQLQLIELIRHDRIEEAIQFAQTRLAEAGESDPRILNELERTLALLAFEDPAKSPFGDLMDESHKQRVASNLNEAILRMEHSESPSPKLSNLLKLIFWAESELEKKKVKFPRMTDLATESSKYLYSECYGRR